MYISSYWAEIGQIFHELLGYRGFGISSVGFYGFYIYLFLRCHWFMACTITAVHLCLWLSPMTNATKTAIMIKGLTIHGVLK